jgi:TfoX/Sxy family transcriptional regulator of competence genes
MKGVFVSMAYSEELADRIRQVLAHLSSVREQRMFGGLSFMVDGHLCVGAHRSGGMLLRCDPAVVDEMLTRKGARWAEMKGKPMGKGWLLIGSEGMTSQEDFASWIGIALDFQRKRREENVT